MIVGDFNIIVVGGDVRAKIENGVRHVIRKVFLIPGTVGV